MGRLFFLIQTVYNLLSKSEAMKMRFRFPSFAQLDLAGRTDSDTLAKISMFKKRDESCRLMVYANLSRLK